MMVSYSLLELNFLNFFLIKDNQEKKNMIASLTFHIPKQKIVELNQVNLIISIK